MRKQISAIVAVLEGIDLVVFTGGIGEKDATVRAAICRGLAWIGLDLDVDRNRLAANPINATHARCALQGLPLQEDEQIARHAASIVAAQL